MSSRLSMEPAVQSSAFLGHSTEKENMSPRGSKGTLRGWANLSDEPQTFKDMGLTMGQEPKDTITKKDSSSFDSWHVPKKLGISVSSEPGRWRLEDALGL